MFAPPIANSVMHPTQVVLCITTSSSWNAFEFDEAISSSASPASSLVLLRTNFGRSFNETLVVFVKSSEKETSARERVIAEVARVVHGYFLFQPRVDGASQ